MKIIALLVYFLLPLCCIAQNSLDELLDQYNDETIPYITVKELVNIKDKIVLLDARELPEYQISHLKGSIHVGYDYFDIKIIENKKLSKETKIIVYCSLGIRSEDIAEQLKKEGFKNVYNLYGGIFEWKNKNLEVVDINEKTTNRVHAYSVRWGKWLHNAKKVYQP